MTPQGYGRPALHHEIPGAAEQWRSGTGLVGTASALPYLLPAPPPTTSQAVRAEHDRPNVARMYDYLTGGSHNFGPDRVAVGRLLDSFPDAARAAAANRAFTARAVRFLVAAGVRQFIDLGAGIPSATSVHRVTATAGAEARVLYVDTDPVVIAHSRSVLAGDASVRIIRADLRRPDHILADPGLLGHIDMSRPVAVLMSAVLDFVADRDDPAGLVAAYRDALPRGGYLVISHGMTGNGPMDDAMVDVFRDTGMPMYLRSRPQIERLFAGTTPVAPGLVRASRWWPAGLDGPSRQLDRDDDPMILAGVACVPGAGPQSGRRDVWAARSRNSFPVSRVDQGPPINSTGAVLRNRGADRDGKRGTPASRWSPVPRYGRVSPTTAWAR